MVCVCACKPCQLCLNTINRINVVPAAATLLSTSVYDMKAHHLLLSSRWYSPTCITERMMVTLAPAVPTWWRQWRWSLVTARCVCVCLRGEEETRSVLPPAAPVTTQFTWNELGWARSDSQRSKLNVLITRYWPICEKYFLWCRTA